MSIRISNLKEGLFEQLLWNLGVFPPPSDIFLFLVMGHFFESFFKHNVLDKIFFLDFKTSFSRGNDSFELVPEKIFFFVHARTLSFEIKIFIVQAIESLFELIIVQFRPVVVQPVLFCFYFLFMFWKRVLSSTLRTLRFKNFILNWWPTSASALALLFGF